MQRVDQRREQSNHKSDRCRDDNSFIFPAHGSSSSVLGNMASICKLPMETLLHVIDYLDDIQDVSSFARAGNHFIHSVAIPVLYSRVRTDVGVMCWACDEGRLGTIKRLLAAGADPNDHWVQNVPRSYALSDAIRFSLPYNSRWDVKEGLPADDRILSAATRQEMDQVRAEHYQEAEDLDSLRSDDLNMNRDSDTDSDPDSASDIFSEDEIVPRLPHDADHSMVDLRRQYAWTPLHVAARWGHNEIVELLLDHGANIGSESCGYCDCAHPTDRVKYDGFRTLAIDVTNWSPLHTAVCHGQDSTAKLLLSRGASLNTVPEQKYFVHDMPKANVSPLHTACASGNMSIVRFFVDELDIDIETKDHLDHTPVSYAYFTGMWECIDFLVEQGATLNTRIGAYPLVKHACIEARFAEALRLLQLGANAHQSFDEDSDLEISYEPRYPSPSALQCCCLRTIGRVYTDVNAALRTQRQKHLRVEVVKELMKPEYLAANSKSDWFAALNDAARYHFFDVIQVFLEAGVGDYTDWLEAFTEALQSEGWSGHGNLVKTVEVMLPFLEQRRITRTFVFESIMEVLGADHKRKDKRAVVERLLSRRPGSSLTRNMARKIWGQAFGNYSSKLCKILLDSGLEPPGQKDLGHLMSAAIEDDSVAALKYLFSLNKSTEPLLTGRHLFKALALESMNCAEILITMGIPTDYRTADGDTCLLQACQLPEPYAALMLLDEGADPNLYGRRADDVPLLQAALGRHPDLVEVLLEKGANVHEVEGYAGALTFAFYMGLEDSIPPMVESESFKQASQAQRDEYIWVALTAPFRSWCAGRNLEVLLSRGQVDPNQMFEAGIPPLVDVLLAARPNAIEILKANGADIHQRLNRGAPARLNPEPTVLELAIWEAEHETVGNLLYEETLSCADKNNETEDPAAKPKGIPPEMAANYVRAACRRHKPQVVNLLRKHGLDFKCRDPHNGDTAVHMVCQYLQACASGEQTDMFDDDPNEQEHRSAYIATRTAVFLNHLVSDLGVDPAIKNHMGVSGCEQVRQRIEYHGENGLLRKVATVWEALLDIDGECIRLTDEIKERFVEEGEVTVRVVEGLSAQFRAPPPPGFPFDDDDDYNDVASWPDVTIL